MCNENIGGPAKQNKKNSGEHHISQQPVNAE
jgi:hypothetical protein